jgi:surface protein
MAEMNLSTAELLQQTIDIKKDMRTAIGDKGVTVVSGMESYPSAIENIPQEVYVGNTKLYDGITCGYSTCTELPMFDTSEMTTMKQMFRYCEQLITIPQYNTSSVTDMTSMFAQCESLTSIPQLDTSNVTTMDGMFHNCHALTTLPLLECGNVTSFDQPVFGCFKLVNFGGFKDLGKHVGVIGVQLNQSSKITNESWINIFNNLWDRSAPAYNNYHAEIYIRVVPLQNMPDEIKEIATSKGWTLTGWNG